jgi:hypothetical protein
MRRQHKVEGAIKVGISVADEILKNAERNGSFGSDSVENREVLMKNLGSTKTPFVKKCDKRKVGSGSLEANRQGQHPRAHVIPKVKMRDKKSLDFLGVLSVPFGVTRDREQELACARMQVLEIAPGAI